ncbi:unnamed protein product [Dicrocoelium dendriticum]|nr:unnamed protein product [Dicrocoelium dendriticum]
MSDCSQRILETRLALCEALRKHHDFLPRQTEILQLANELEALKEIVPSLTTAHPPSADGDSIQPLPKAHAEVVSTLCEAVDMYNNCKYLLAVHRSIEQLSSSVRQLCQCVRKPKLWEPAPDDQDWMADDELASLNDTADNCVGTSYQHETDPFHFEIDEDSYKLCTNAVVLSLGEVESLMNQPTKFSKDTTLVLHGFRQALRDLKIRLNEHIDLLWRHWFVWHTRTREALQNNPPSSLSRLLLDLRLINGVLPGSTLPSATEAMELLAHPVDKWIPTDVGPFHPSPLLASLTVYAKPELLAQLFRLVDALGDFSGRFHDFVGRLWKHIFEPWLEKAQCVSGSLKFEKGWPTLRSTYLGSDATGSSDFDEGDDVAIHYPRLLPAWRLELVVPEAATDEDDGLILSSCSQLASAFQDLFTNVLSLRPSSNKQSSISSALIMEHSDYFDGVLARRLIEGRFYSVLPSAKQCRSTAFLASVTQAVYSLAMTGKETGFLSGELSENLPVDNVQGGAALLLRWIHSLPQVAEKRRTNEILSRVRNLFADTNLFRFTLLAGTASCTKPDLGVGSLQLPDDDELTDEELCAYEQQSADMHDSPDRLLPSLSRLLQSKANREDLSRYLDMGHFHFPLCKISKVVTALMDVINELLVEAQTYIDHLTADQDAMEHDTTRRATTIKLATGIIELVPRLIMSYTSIVPTVHHQLEKDLYLAALYHNNCTFLAHECLTLGETRLNPLIQKIPPDDENDKQRALERLASVSTCVLVTHLRTAGIEVLLRHLHRYREQITEEVKRTRGLRDLSLPNNRQRRTESLRACLDLLRSVSCGLRPLSTSMYYHCIGSLCDELCEELVVNILRLIDLTTEDCEVLASLLHEVEKEIEELFSTYPDPELRGSTTHPPLDEILKHRVPQLCRIRGIISILTSCTLVGLKERLWNHGEGPLAVTAQLRPSEVRSLVEAVYSQSKLRDEFLKELR